MSEPADVILISMPFGPIGGPSIGLSLLKGALQSRGIAARIIYFNLKFAELIGSAVYQDVSEGTLTSQLAGEWIFSGAFFGPKSEDEIEDYTNQILRRRGIDPAREDTLLPPTPEPLIGEILGVAERVEPFLLSCLSEVLACRPRLVGFTDVFQQQVASLALARQIKAHLPDTLIVFGGGNCEGVMGRELMRQFSFLDAVVSGEGDLVFPELVSRALDRKPLDTAPGVLLRGLRLRVEEEGRETNTPVIKDLDTLPYPDYDDYFVQLRESPLSDWLIPSLPFETARGCWWGARHHCTFCGLNGATMTYRSKSAPRALAELEALSSRHPGCIVNVVDNILDMRYFRDFVPLLAKRRLGLSLSYEVKANLTKDQLRSLRKAGIRAIQPGIESFGDEVLRIMRKGVRGLQNIQLLKWCLELDILPVWNLIWGFPGEPEAEYGRMAEWIPLMTHLTPPAGAVKIRTDRFSPNFDRAADLGFQDLRPYPAYQHVYALEPEAIANLAYHFTYAYAVPQDVERYALPVVQQVRRWVASHQQSRLFSVEKGKHLLIWDSRPIARSAAIVLDGLAKDGYQCCDEVSTPQRVVRLLSQKGRYKRRPPDLNELRDRLDDLTDRGLMIRQDDSYLSLAVPRSLKR